MGCGASSTRSKTNALDTKIVDGVRIVSSGYMKAKYTKISELGKGASCYVHAMEDIETGEQYAIKVLEKPALQTLWNQEWQLLQHLKHPHVLEYVDKFEGPKNYYITTGLCKGGELFDRVAEGKFTDRLASDLMRKMLTGLLFCHDQNIVHRDLKPENFVFDGPEETANIRLIDFGCARKVKDDEEVEDVCGSPYYVAPEVLNQEGVRTGATWKASDVWSMGVVAFLLVCGTVPFNGSNEDNILRAIKRGKYIIPRNDGNIVLSDSVRDFITMCLNFDPTARISVKQALAHPWVNGDTATDTAISTAVISNIVQFGKQCKLKKAVGKVLSNKISQRDKNELADLFKMFDKDNNGKLSPAEITEMLKYIGKSPDDAKEILENLDDDGDGEIDMGEMKTLVAAQQDTAAMKASFKLFDKDGDGFVSAAEIEQMCSWMSADDRKEMIKEADGSGDGKIDFDEWITAMAANGQTMRNPKPDDPKPDDPKTE